MKKLILLLGALLCSQFANAACTPATLMFTQYVNSSGNPCSSCTIEAFDEGTTTPALMYSDSACSSLGTSVTLNSNGLPSSLIWLDNTKNYKFVLKDSSGTTMATADALPPIGKGDSTIAGNLALTAAGATDRTIDVYNTNGGLEIQVDGATGDVELWNTNSSGTAEDQLFDCPRNSGNSYCAGYYNNSKRWESSSEGFDVTGDFTASGSGPHAFGGTNGSAQFFVSGSFLSDGSGSTASGFRLDSTITGHSLDSDGVFGFFFNPNLWAKSTTS